MSSSLFFHVVWVLMGALLLSGCFVKPQGTQPTPQPEQGMAAPHPNTQFVEKTLSANPLKNRWIVNAIEAVQLIEAGATVLDARHPTILTKKLPGAIPVRWQQFASRDPVTRGRLLANDQQLTQKLQALGISSDIPVVVFANPPQGWGEEGRIVWMLRTLGHPQAVMVEGGYRALAKTQGKPLQAQTPAPGDFVVNRNNTWSIERDTLKMALKDQTVAVIDTREQREYAGKVPYGERRGGHIPGAIHLYFKTFMHQDGRLLPSTDIQQKLLQQGITPDTPVVVYCTGGIRSAWLVTVLASLGYSVQNYPGSMWEWAAGPAADYPLDKQ